MARKRYTEEQIIAVLKEGQSGVSTAELSRKHGVSDATIYKWKSKFSGMEVSDVRKLRQLEDENRRLKHLVADLTLDNQALKAINSKNW
jgi:putative transposase